MTYSEGPNLPYPLEKQSCGRIIDPATGHPLVIIAGGQARDDDADETEITDDTFIWDTVTDIITKVSTCVIQVAIVRELTFFN